MLKDAQAHLTIHELGVIWVRVVNTNFGMHNIAKEIENIVLTRSDTSGSDLYNIMHDAPSVRERLYPDFLVRRPEPELLVDCLAFPQVRTEVYDELLTIESVPEPIRKKVKEATLKYILKLDKSKRMEVLQWLLRGNVIGEQDLVELQDVSGLKQNVKRLLKA